MTELTAGKVAVVTGAAGGIGYALAEALAARGLHVALADRDGAALAAATDRVKATGASVIGVSVDVGDRSSVAALREAVLAAFGRVDVLCNNAGLFNPVKPMWERDLGAWERLMQVNYWGVVYGTMAFLPDFLAQGAGHVIITASMSGLSTVPGLSDYVCSKHGVVALAETLRADLDLAGKTGIGVTLLCPSLVRTPMGERAVGQFEDNTAGRAKIGSGPNLAAMIEPAEMAAAALAGIEADQLYVLPTPQSRQRFEKRIAPIAAAFAAAPITH